MCSCHNECSYEYFTYWCGMCGLSQGQQQTRYHQENGPIFIGTTQEVEWGSKWYKKGGKLAQIISCPRTVIRATSVVLGQENQQHQSIGGPGQLREQLQQCKDKPRIHSSGSNRLKI
ncbi:unnamed protein product [Meganyctiphanes norvegica]|uniref:Uncharacterized protein n=1 Tax=Meganyctiphanes norvegica TaxID=48144 RepID=A0AAV2SNX3_MEGNR